LGQRGEPIDQTGPTFFAARSPQSVWKEKAIIASTQQQQTGGNQHMRSQDILYRRTVPAPCLALALAANTGALATAWHLLL